MHTNQAYAILEIDPESSFFQELENPQDYIRRRYRTIALKVHPDKNGNSEESTKKFQEVNDAYNCLRGSSTDGDDDSFIDKSYTQIISRIISSIIGNSSKSELLQNIIRRILFIRAKSQIYRVFESVDRDVALCVYRFIHTYRKDLGVSDEVMDELRTSLVNRYDSMSIYKLNPNINDLLSANLYKLKIGEDLVIVPLWISESYFDIDGSEMLVICEPHLPEHMKIDDTTQTLHVDINIPIHEPLHRDKFYYSLVPGNSHHDIIIEWSDISMKSTQVIRLKKRGLVQHTTNTFEIARRGDILLYITLTAH